jgi:hypothetical protein
LMKINIEEYLPTYWIRKWLPGIADMMFTPHSVTGYPAA